MRSYARWLAVSIAYVGCAQFAFLAFIQNPGNPDDFDKARLLDLVDGSAPRPWVLRTLFPTTVRVIRSFVPDAARATLQTWATQVKPLRRLLQNTPADEQCDPTTFLIAYALEFLSVLGFALVLRAAIKHFYGATSWVADLIPAGAVAALPMFNRYISYDYDLPRLFLFTWAILLLARRRWTWFYPMLVLCALSKETAVLLVMIHLLGHAGRLPVRVLARHAAAQLAIVLVIRAVLQFVLYAENPGAPVEMWLARNWDMISDPSRWGFLFFHFTWVGHTALAVPTNYNVLFLLLVPLIAAQWSQKPLFLRRALWVLPALFVLMFCFAYIDEMRDYYEAYPIVVLLIAHTMLEPGEGTAPEKRPAPAGPISGGASRPVP